MLAHTVLSVIHLVGLGHHFGAQPPGSGLQTEEMRVSLPFVCIALGCVPEYKYGRGIPKFQAGGGDVGSTSMLPSEQTIAQNIFLTCLVGDAFLKKPL